MRNSNGMVWEFLEENLNESVPCALLIVVESEGSSPGRKGFKMAVNDRKEMSGSIGGGIMEVKLVEKVFREMQDGRLETHLVRQEHNKKSPLNQSGMICSGFQTILIMPILPAFLEQIVQCKKALMLGQNALLTINYSEKITKLTIAESGKSGINFNYRSENEFDYTELLGQKDTVVIIGGGHCSLALSELLNWLDFNIHILETRPDINTLTSNKFVHHLDILDSYEDILRHIPDANSFIVVMTVGYRQDMMVLRQILGRGYRYIGVLGSKQKIETLRAALLKEFSDDTLKEMHAPIGLDISSKTVREIAVSIAAQIIKIRNG